MADITITEGDTLEVDYSLENTGDGTGTFDPRLLVEGVQEDQDTGITLDPAQTATGTLQWPTVDGDAVTDALVEAETDDTSDSITVTVESSTIEIDNFNDGDVSSYQGQTSQINAVTTNPPPYEGTHSGLVSGNLSNDIVALTGFSFSSPVVFEGAHRHVENAGTCRWALLNGFGGDTSAGDGDDPGYWMLFNGGNGDIALSAGTESDSLGSPDASGSTNIGYDEWTEWSLTINSGTATFNYGGTEISTTNTPYSSFSGWASYTFRDSAFDDLKYTTL